MPTDLTETDKRVLIKDHDVLIGVYTLQGEMLRRFDEYIKSDNEKHEKTAVELRTISIDQVKLNGEMDNLKTWIGGVSSRVDKLDTKSLRIDLAILVGTIVAGAIAWFR